MRLMVALSVAAGLAVFSAFPWAATPPGAALLKVALKHVAAPMETGTALSQEELEKLPRHMRPPGGQAGAGPAAAAVATGQGDRAGEPGAAADEYDQAGRGSDADAEGALAAARFAAAGLCAARLF